MKISDDVRGAYNHICDRDRGDDRACDRGDGGDDGDARVICARYDSSYLRTPHPHPQARELHGKCRTPSILLLLFL